MKHLFHSIIVYKGSHPPGNPGKVGEFESDQGRVGEYVFLSEIFENDYFTPLTMQENFNTCIVSH